MVEGEQWQLTYICKLMALKANPLTAPTKTGLNASLSSGTVLQPKSATASSSGGHTAERCEHTAIELSKLSDLATPLLLQNCSSGKTIPKAKFEFMRADSKGERIKYFEIELVNVLISSVAPSVAEGSILTETVGLKFSQVKWKYIQQKISGGSGGNTSGGWDLATNKVV